MHYRGVYRGPQVVLVYGEDVRQDLVPTTCFFSNHMVVLRFSKPLKEFTKEGRMFKSLGIA